VAVILCVPIALAIRALGNLSFVLWWLKFNLTLLKEFNIKCILIVRGWFEVYKKTWRVVAWSEIA
jgi:hypothetical protein